MIVSLEGQTAVVTGGAGGLGLATVKRLLADGARVAVWDFDPNRSAAARATLPADAAVRFISCDLTRLESVEAAFAETEAAFGKVDILVNNAGIVGAPENLWEGSPAAWIKVIEVNLFGQYHACRVLAPHMMANGYGRILNVASVAGKEGNALMSSYSASKGAVIAMTKSLAKELAPHGVLVNAITPSIFRSDLSESVSADVNAALIAKVPLARLGEPEEIAQMIGFLVSRETSFSTGAVFDISGGRSAY